ILFERRADGRDHVKVPRLAEDRHDGRARLDQRLEVAILLRAYTRTARGAEGADLRALEHRVLHSLEEPEVLRVAARPAALDVVDAERIEPLGDPNLVLHRKGHALALGAVAKGRVVDL